MRFQGELPGNDERTCEDHLGEAQKVHTSRCQSFAQLASLGNVGLNLADLGRELDNSHPQRCRCRHLVHGRFGRIR